MSTRKPSPGPLPDCVWWGTDVAPIPQAWEGPQPASDPPPAVPAHPADRWKRAARPHACAPVSHAGSLSQRVHPSQPPPLHSAYRVTSAFAAVSSAALIAVAAGPLLANQPRRLPVTRPPAGLCLQGGPAADRAGGPLAGRGGGGGLPGARGGHGRAAGRHR